MKNITLITSMGYSSHCKGKTAVRSMTETMFIDIKGVLQSTLSPFGHIFQLISCDTRNVFFNSMEKIRVDSWGPEIDW